MSTAKIMKRSGDWEISLASARDSIRPGPLPQALANATKRTGGAHRLMETPIESLDLTWAGYRTTPVSTDREPESCIGQPVVAPLSHGSEPRVQVVLGGRQAVN